MVMLKSKQGAQGIGTLIIFIALILVAAVAAGVLIQTSGSLQSKSLDVGRQAQEKITTSIDVVQVYANGTNDSNIDSSIYVVVRLGSGSEPVKLSDLILKMDSKAGSQTLLSGTAANTTTYASSYLTNGGAAQTTGYLVSGDLAVLEFETSNTVSEAETASIKLISKNGAVKPIDVTAPSAMIEDTTYLYP